ncbi:lysylphosphatidylglycerol synthase transmembrane domain-containing protein [Ligilactobacillus apodemi]|uniref:lysylphosphatidylglycerol synthase transmembrane domain-containing protein n=1 Tax=Ligilactobacillus apodemi TaxID=307126 RepID=UPI00214BE8E8|nr:lysylphosphatidylglycerol synthase transmembrane domain-containing protein [Ligilactobacillus apodemi]MCR1902057.1 flippase-like domain-containing protein [Ligilactobacillus apodemi]
MSKKNKIALALMLLLGIGIFIYSVRGVSYRALVDDIHNLHWGWIVVAFLCMGLSILCEAIVVKRLLKRQFPDFSLKDSLRIPLIEALFNGITPFSSGGQPAQLFALVQSGVDAGRATSILLMKFVVYQSMIVINFIVCLFLGFHLIADKLHVMGILLLFGFVIHLAVIIGLLLIMYWYNFTKKLTKLCLKPFKRFLAPARYERYDKMINEKIDNFYRESLTMKDNYKLLFQISLITLVQLFFYYIIPYFILLALRVDHVSLVTVMTLHVLIVMIISLFPIPGGAGGAEYSFSLIFSTFVDSGSKLVLAMLIWRIITYYFGMFGGMVALVISPRKYQRKTLATKED